MKRRQAIKETESKIFPVVLESSLFIGPLGVATLHFLIRATFSVCRLLSSWVFATTRSLCVPRQPGTKEQEDLGTRVPLLISQLYWLAQGPVPSKGKLQIDSENPGSQLERW